MTMINKIGIHCIYITHNLNLILFYENSTVDHFNINIQ